MITSEDARRRAIEVLQECGVTRAPVPIERIIKKKNIVLRFAPLEDDLSGMAYINEGVGIIGVNALHHANRQRFTAAHELGHHMLHHDEISQAVHVDKGFPGLMRNETSTKGTDALEVQANAFASELLMPKQFVLQEVNLREVDLENEEQIEALAKKFRVSTSAISIRLKSLAEELLR